VRNLLRRLYYRIRCRRFDAELAEEIEFHRAMKERDWERAGLTAADARRMSHRDMGNITLARECSREVWIAAWFDSLGQDVRYAFRSLRGQPGFTITAGAALVLGIGLNTSLFTLLNAVMLRPWAVADPAACSLRTTSTPPRPAGARAVSALPNTVICGITRARSRDSLRGGRTRRGWATK
jgi:hypothetical protein